jgi:hypothetical protein
MLGVRKRITSNQLENLISWIATLDFDFSVFKSLNTARASVAAEYWARKPKIPEANKIPRVAHLTGSAASARPSLSKAIVTISKNVGANWEKII